MNGKVYKLRLYGYMWAHPGKKLLFMGGEFGQWREWNDSESLDWHLLQKPVHEGMQKLVSDLNHHYLEQRALWEADGEAGGFEWIEVDNALENVLAFRRRSPSTGQEIICVSNLSPVPRGGHRLGLPRAGEYQQILNTDEGTYCGGGLSG